MRRLLVAGWLFACVFRGAPALAEDFPSSLTMEEARALPAASELIHGYANALLEIPKDGAPAEDPRDNTSFREACYVYLLHGSQYERRFAIHLKDRDELPIARQAARFLALLWTAADRRFGPLSSKLQTPVDVWMSRSGEAGGEQFRSSLYIYDIFAERTGIEWARELAHEYGHFLLPGSSGYTDPESWSNGVLGERLFLKWILDDERAGTLNAAEAPYVKPADLEDHRAKQITPLIDRMARSGPDPALLAQTDRRAMNAFTGLMLYVDEVYGGATLVNMLENLPRERARAPRGSDFLVALQGWIGQAQAWTMRLRGGEQMVYVPRGSYRVTAQGPAPKTLRLGGDAKLARAAEGWMLRSNSAGWRPITVDGGPATLRFEKR